MTQDCVELKTICDSVLHAYLARIADTAEKRHYLYFLWTVADSYGVENGVSKSFPESLEDFDTFLEDLQRFKVFDLYPSLFEQSYDLRVLLVTMVDCVSVLPHYLRGFRSDQERSREFHYDVGLWSTLVATLYMRYLRTLSDSR